MHSLRKWLKREEEERGLVKLTAGTLLKRRSWSRQDGSEVACLLGSNYFHSVVDLSVDCKHSCQLCRN